MAKHLFFVTGIVIIHLVAITLQYPIVRPKNPPYETSSYEDSESEQSSESELYSDSLSESESKEIVKPLRKFGPIGLIPRAFRTSGHRAIEALTDTPPTQAFFELMKNILESLKSSTKVELRRAKQRHVRNNAWKK